MISEITSLLIVTKLEQFDYAGATAIGVVMLLLTLFLSKVDLNRASREELYELPGFTCQTPGGAFYVWPNVTEACRMVGAADSEEFRKRLLNEAGVELIRWPEEGSKGSA